jgi:twinkle protein
MNLKELSDRMAKDAANIVQFLLPQGKKSSGEWKVGGTTGEPGHSMSIRLTGAKAGIWSDFATGESGDLIDLWASVRGLSISEAANEAKQFMGVREDRPSPPKKEYKRPSKPKCQSPKSAVKDWLNSRGLTDETIAAFKIGEQLVDGKAYAVFPYLREGVLINAKYRNPVEKKDMRQEGGAEPCLYGWHLIDPKCRTVAITEGEIDAMSLHQCGIPALSVNAGAGNHQWVESDWDRLDRFSEILICYDSDEAGQKGAREIASKLGTERCRLVTFPLKDANECLMQGFDGSDFYDSIKDAKYIAPEEFVPISDFMGRVKALFYPASGEELDPHLALDTKLDWFHFRLGELTVWTGYNGHGKSLMLAQVFLGLMSQGVRTMVFSGEMTPERQLKRLAKQATGMDRPSPAYLDAVGRWLMDKMWIFNMVGSATIDRLLEVFLYANRRHGITHFVIDSLMMTDVPEDGPGSMTAQKEAIRKICNFARKNGIHIHLVAHPRKGIDEKHGPGKMDVAGSSKITDGADNVFTVWSARNDESDPELDPDKPDAKLELQKQRNGDVQHYTQWLYFCKEAQQFVSTSRRKPCKYVEFSSQDIVKV